VLRFRSLTGLAFAVLFLGCHPRDEAARVPLAAPPPGRGSTASAGPSPPASAARPAKRVIVFVWDGLRPDSIDETDTPRLAEIAARGTVFTDHHATYPTFTMINGATFATGSLVASTGFYGNWLWQPLVPKKSPSGVPLVSGEIVFTDPNRRHNQRQPGRTNIERVPIKRRQTTMSIGTQPRICKA